MASIKDIIQSNSTFLRNVFLTLISQLIITSLVVYVLRDYDQLVQSFYTWWVQVILFITMIILIFLMIVPNISNAIRFVLFTIFSLIFGILLARLNRVNKTVLMSALVGTVSVFIVMFFLGILTIYYKMDLNYLALFLFICLIMLIISGFIFMFCGVTSTTYKIYLYIGLVVFALYIMLDTNTMLKYRLKENNFVAGALSYYLDIINIFIRLISLSNR